MLTHFSVPYEVWPPIVSGTARTFAFRAQRGIKGAILGTTAEQVDRWLHHGQEAHSRHARPLRVGENLAPGGSV